jgi:hypothetical protein
VVAGAQTEDVRDLLRLIAGEGRAVAPDSVGPDEEALERAHLTVRRPQSSR